MLSLGPSPRLSPRSSLGHMLGRVMEAFGASGSAELVLPSGVDTGGFAHALEEAIVAGTPVCLLGTAFAFVHALETLAPTRFPLPPGSRLMDTGGYKGRSREVPRDELLRLYEETFAIPASHVISEYGMTEMSSQFYGRQLSALGSPRSPEASRRKAPPHQKQRAESREPRAASTSRLPGCGVWWSIRSGWRRCRWGKPDCCGITIWQISTR
jgi:hypothetical protein